MAAQGSDNTKTGAGVREPMHGPAGHRPASPPASQAEPVNRPDVDKRGDARPGRDQSTGHNKR